MQLLRLRHSIPNSTRSDKTREEPWSNCDPTQPLPTWSSGISHWVMMYCLRLAHTLSASCRAGTRGRGQNARYLLTLPVSSPAAFPTPASIVYSATFASGSAQHPGDHSASQALWLGSQKPT